MAKAQDAGFTLIELIITVSILGIIIGALAGSIIVVLSTTDDTNRRLAESHDAQIAAAYFVNDVQSAWFVDKGATPLCGTAGMYESSAVSFRSTDTVSPTSDVAHTVSYVVTQTASSKGEKQLRRLHCTGGSSQPADQEVISDFAVNPVVVTCSPLTCVMPAEVTMIVTEISGYTYTLRGKGRVG